MDGGEAEAIQLAIDLGADFLLMDEVRGRRTATETGLVVVGILGILLHAYRRKILAEPLEVMRQLRKEGFRVSRRLFLEFEEQIRILGTP